MWRIRRPGDAVSACTVHPVRLGETAGMSPVAGFPASGHGPCRRPACPVCHGGQAQPGEGRVLPAVSPRPRRRPLEDGMIAFLVRADLNPTASFCPLCLLIHTLSSRLIPAVVRSWLGTHLTGHKGCVLRNAVECAEEAATWTESGSVLLLIGNEVSDTSAQYRPAPGRRPRPPISRRTGAVLWPPTCSRSDLRTRACLDKKR